MTWEQIAAYFPGRTSHALQSRYNEVLVENESLASASDPSGHELEVKSGQQTINEGSPNLYLPRQPITRRLRNKQSMTSLRHLVFTISMRMAQMQDRRYLILMQ